MKTLIAVMAFALTATSVSAESKLREMMRRDMPQRVAQEAACEELARVYYRMAAERDTGLTIIQMLDHYAEYPVYTTAVRHVYNYSYTTPTDHYLDAYDECMPSMSVMG